MEIERILNNLHQSSFVLQSRLYENTQRIILLSLLLLGGVCNAETDETISVTEGNSVILNTNLFEILNDNTILWTFGPKGSVLSQVTRKNDLPVTTFTDDVRFTGRLQVDQKTGSLTIRNTRNRHSGQYKLTISREKITYRIFHVNVSGVVGEMNVVKPVSVIEGESIILLNDATKLQKYDLIVWRFGNKGILLGKVDVETKNLSLNDADERFKNRLRLDETGSLTITNARTEHSGLYEVQIEGRGSLQQFIVSVSAEWGQSSTVISVIVVAVVLMAGFIAAMIYFVHKISNLQKRLAEEEKVSGIEGRTIALRTGTKLQNGDEIKWWYGDDNNPLTQRSEWAITNDDIDCDVTDERFRNKLQMGGRTGDLIISYIRTIHSGVYKVQISGKTRTTKIKRFIVTVNVKEVEVKVGKSATLKTDIEIQKGDVILWTFGVKNRLIFKAESGPTNIYESFSGRLQLNDQDGSLTITNITKEDFGHFQLQVMNGERNRFRRFNVIEGNKVKKLMEKKPLLSQEGVDEDDEQQAMSSV
ncbi:hypothetical protein Q8A67_018945 [Cirrhinus molitorella]|uniref:Immunoglobulin domain-containing protein n=1 Tax=Cirrhinus molitorella TaxID=172907 RepID=A0AA88PH93_9TELE|nr:hypothetical protein Q8A67_018945 [Cirrhinus molitorella]